jgi:molecular chaperone GrpE
MKEEKEEKIPNQTEKELEDCKKQREEYLNGWKREKADFLNYKKREAERAGELFEFAVEKLVLMLLPVLDNLEKAEKEIPEKDLENEYIRGVLQVKSQLENFLKSLGVEKIEAEGKKFDPAVHEAIEVKEEKEGGKVLEEIKTGYKLKGKIIRPAKVKVSR